MPAAFGAVHSMIIMMTFVEAHIRDSDSESVADHIFIDEQLGRHRVSHHLQREQGERQGGDGAAAGTVSRAHYRALVAAHGQAEARNVAPEHAPRDVHMKQMEDGECYIGLSPLQGLLNLVECLRG